MVEDARSHTTIREWGYLTMGKRSSDASGRQGTTCVDTLGRSDIPGGLVFLINGEAKELEGVTLLVPTKSMVEPLVANEESDAFCQGSSEIRCYRWRPNSTASILPRVGGVLACCEGEEGRRVQAQQREHMCAHPWWTQIPYR